MKFGPLLCVALALVMAVSPLLGLGSALGSTAASPAAGTPPVPSAARVAHVVAHAAATAPVVVSHVAPKGPSAPVAKELGAYYYYVSETGLPSGVAWYTWDYIGSDTESCPTSLTTGWVNATDTTSSTSAINRTEVEDSYTTAWTACYFAFDGYTPSPTSGSGTGSENIDVTYSLAPPPAPTGLTATPAETSATLSWTNPTGPGTITGDEVAGAHYDASTASCGTYPTPTALGVATSYTPTGLSPSTEYCAEVAAENNAGYGPFAVITFTTLAGPTASISASHNPTDVGTSVTFTASVSGGTSPYTYAWTVSSTAQSSTSSTMSYTFSASGTYTVGLSVKDADGIYSNVTLSETVDPALVASASANLTTADAGYSIAFTGSATGGSGTYTYSWTVSGTQISTAASFGHSFSTAGSYTVDFTVTDSNGLTDTASVAVTINADPTVTVASSANPADEGYAVTFTATGSGGTGTLSYAWTVGGTAEGTGASLSYTFSAAGSYTVTATVTDGERQSDSYSVTETVEANPTVSISISPNPTDVGVAATFTASPSGGVSPYSYVWTVNSATISGTSATDTYTPSSSGTFTVEVTVTDADGHTASASGDLSVNGAVSAAVSSGQNPTDAGNTVTYTASASGGTPPYTYAWKEGSTSECSTSSTCSIDMSSTGSFTITVTVTDTLGNTYTTSLTETVEVDPTVTISSSQNPTDVGNSPTFTATVSNGVSPYTYSWTVNGATQSSTTSGMSYDFASSGTHYVNVTVTDSVGVVTTYSFAETVNVDPSVSVTPSKNPTDVGVAVTFTASASGGSGTISYAWTVNSVTQSSTSSTLSWTPSSSGTYTIEITVTDSVGNTYTTSLTETVNGAVSAAVSSGQNPTDAGNTVTFTASASGGTPPYTYAWKEGSTSECSTSSTCSIDMSSTGSFTITVTVTDTLGNTYTTSLTETVEVDPTVTISSSQNPTDVGNSPTFTATVSNGVSPYTYSWTVNGATQSSTTSGMSYDFAAAGTYYVNVTVTDSVSVTTKYSLVETVNADPSVTATPSANPVDAGVAVTFTASASGGSGTISYAWTVNSVTQSSTSSTLSWTPSSSGTYTIEVTVTDGVGKSDSATVDETVNADPSVTFSAQYNPVDKGVADVFTPTISGGVGPYTYSWTVGGTVEGTGSTLSYAFGATGTFEVGLTVTDADGKTATASLSVTVQSDPAVTASGPTAWDEGIGASWTSTVSYGATPYTYSWTVNGASVGTAASLSYTFSAAGSYTLNLTVTDAQGVKGYYQETVTVNAQPSVSASASASAADVGSSVTFTATITAGTAPYTYVWTADGSQVGTASTLTWSVTTAGTNDVEVEITDAAGAHATSSEVLVTGNDLPSASLSAEHSPTDPGILDTITSTVTAGTAPYTYAWTIDGTAQSSTASSLSWTPSSPGTYTINVTVTDADGNAAKASVSVTVETAISVAESASPTTGSVGVSTTFTATESGGVGPFAYAWTNDSVSIGTANPLDYTFHIAGTFYVNVTVTDSLGLTAKASIEYTVNNAPSASITESATSTDVGLSISFGSTVSGGVAPYTYKWYVSSVSEGTASTLDYTFTSTGTFTVELVVTDADGLTSSPTVTITVNPSLSASVSATYTLVDVGISDTFTAAPSGGTSPYSYAWTVNGAAQTGTSKSEAFTFSTPGTYTINATVTDAAGESEKVSLSVTVNARPSVTESESPSPGSVNVGSKFTADVSGGVGPYTYAWTENGTSIGTTNPLSYTFTAAGDYWVNITVTDSFGIVATASDYYAVANAPSATITESATSTDVGLSISFGSTVSGGVPPYTYKWTVNGAAEGTGSTMDYLFSATGSYTVELVVTDADGLTSSPTVTITVNPSLTASLSATYTLVDTGISDTVTAEPSAGTAPYSYTWAIDGAVQSGTSKTLTFSETTPGTYAVNVTVTDAAGEAATAKVSITVVARPAATIVAEYNPVDVGVSDEFSPSVSGGVAPYSYSWLEGGVLTNTTHLTLNFTAAGSYTVQLTVTDSFGVQSTVSVSVTVMADPVVTEALVNPPAVVSLDSEYHAAATGGYGTYTFAWSFPGETQSTGPYANYTWESSGPVAYQLTVSDQGGYTHTLDLTGYAHLYVLATSNVSEGPAPLLVSFDSSVLGGSSYAYNWTLGNGHNSVDAVTQATYYAGNYTVELVVTSANGAKGWDNITITSLPGVPPVLVVTGVESPIVTQTVLSVSAAKSTDSDATILYYNWTLGAATFHGPNQNLWFNATGTFTLGLLVTDSRGASASETFSIVVTLPSTNTTSIHMVVTTAKTSTGDLYTLSVSSTDGISAADAFLGGTVLSLTQVGSASVSGGVTYANYTLALNPSSFSIGNYVVSFTVWNNATRSNTVSAAFVVAPASGGPGFNVINAVGGEVNFWLIITAVIGTAATVYGVTRRNTVDVDVAGIQLQGRKGRPLVVTSTGAKERKGGGK